jgi:EAP30/Vps36 family
LQAVKKLEILDKSFQVIPDPKKVSSSSKKRTKFYVSSVPREIDMAFQDVLQAAQGKGYVAQAELAQLPMWSAERAKLTLLSMVQEGVCMIDDGDAGGQTLYWFPVLFEGQV